MHEGGVPMTALPRVHFITDPHGYTSIRIPDPDPPATEEQLASREAARVVGEVNTKFINLCLDHVQDEGVRRMLVDTMGEIKAAVEASVLADLAEGRARDEAEWRERLRAAQTWKPVGL